MPALSKYPDEFKRQAASLVVDGGRSVRMNARFLLREPWPRIIGIPLVALALSSVFHSDKPAALGYIITLVITGVIWQGSFMIINWFRLHYPGLEHTTRRILLTALATSAYVILIDFVSCSALDALGLKESAYTNGQWPGNLLKCFGNGFHR